MPKSIEVSRKRTTANFKQNHMLLLVTAFSLPPNMFIFHRLRPLKLSSFNEIIQPHPSILDRFTSRLQGPRHRVPLRSCRSQSHHTGYARTRWPAGWHRGLKPLDTFVIHVGGRFGVTYFSQQINGPSLPSLPSPSPRRCRPTTFGCRHGSPLPIEWHWEREQV